jgi:hypothetical protein
LGEGGILNLKKSVKISFFLILRFNNNLLKIFFSLMS